MRKIALTIVVAGLMLCGFAATSAAGTVWLCKPGQHPDPCATGLSTTVYSPTFKRIGVEQPTATAHPAIDCFYVYPTISSEPTGNSDLKIGPEERSIALYQVARYSQYCNVYAPIYQQVTLAGIGNAIPTTRPNPALALSSLRSAFRTYLQRYNHGRGFVFIGQSQGSLMLRQLMTQDVDPKPALRRRMVSAILLGGNVLVKTGTGIGGDFRHIPACRSATQLSCVIAFSTFDQPVPTPTLFGRPFPQLGASGGTPADSVLCTNPAALGGGSGLVDPVWPSQPFDPKSVISRAIAGLGIPVPHPRTVWVSVPNAFRADCSSANDANVLEITPVGGAPTPNPSPSAVWGLHLIDAQVALGNLISTVKSEAAAFAHSGR